MNESREQVCLSSDALFLPHDGPGRAGSRREKCIPVPEHAGERTCDFMGHADTRRTLLWGQSYSGTSRFLSLSSTCGPSGCAGDLRGAPSLRPGRQYGRWEPRGLSIPPRAVVAQNTGDMAIDPPLTSSFMRACLSSSPPGAPLTAAACGQYRVNLREPWWAAARRPPPAARRWRQRIHQGARGYHCHDSLTKRAGGTLSQLSQPCILSVSFIVQSLYHAFLLLQAFLRRSCQAGAGAT
jgi:hypothetical protein